MKIRLTDLPREGLKINDTISLTALNLRMEEGHGNDIIFTREPTAELLITLERDNSDSGAQLVGRICTEYTQPCPKCLESLSQTLKIPLDLILKPGSATTTEDQQQGREDDVGIIYYDGEHIELEEVLQEVLILCLSPFGLEHQGCPGLDALQSTSDNGKSLKFGDLLKAAGVETKH